MNIRAGFKTILPETVLAFFRSRHENILRKDASIVANKEYAYLKRVHRPRFANRLDVKSLRGIDFYTEGDLLPVLEFSLHVFRNVQGYYPSIIEARSFNEKCFRSKFLAKLPVPQSGNKLLTSSFIPTEIQDRLRCPEIVWHSSVPALPGNSQISPGEYYLKASHGSGMFKKIRYPLQDDQRVALENLCASWLKPFGLADGEWWYNTFTPEIIIERQVGLGDTSITWNVYTFGEKVGFVSGYRKLAPISSPLDETTWVDEDFKSLPFQNPNKKRLTEFGISRQTQDSMISFAKAIGRQFKFARVDFLVDHEENVFLGEMTFNPMNGLNTSRPRDFDVWLGDLWDQTSY